MSICVAPRNCAWIYIVISRVAVVGCGLIGTSIGLGLRAHGLVVFLQDTQPDQQGIAVDLGAGEPWSGESVDLIVLATPPASIPSLVSEFAMKYPSVIITDVASTKTHIYAEVQQQAVHARFIGGHPIAGKHVSGAAAAEAQLFDGHVWVLVNEPDTDLAALGVVSGVVELLGATVVTMTAEQHDRLLAVTSHATQVVSSAVALQLLALAQSDVQISGTGMIGMTRLAASEPALWTQILLSNAENTAGTIETIARDLRRVAEALRNHDQASVSEFLAAGREGRRLLRRPEDHVS